MTCAKPVALPSERRITMRFTKVFQVRVSSEDFGEVSAVARNISAGGMLIETPAPLPLGSEVRVHFAIPDSQSSIIVRAEVKNHYAFNCCDGAARGMGVRVLEFVEDGADVLRSSLTRFRTLH
jgi:hypothetical protein